MHVTEFGSLARHNEAKSREGHEMYLQVPSLKGT
jgi:hypothetical protein